MKALILALVAFGLIGQAQARTERVQITFGSEFTFGPGEKAATALERIVARQKEHLIENQPEGSKFWQPSNPPNMMTFISPNGWWVHTHTDPGVIETRMSYHTVDFWRQFKDDIQDAVFVSAANEGCFPQTYLGGGHISVGLSGFGNNSLLIRNFVVDLFNNNELFMGIFSYDSNNALPYGLLASDVQTQIGYILGSYDRGDYVPGEAGAVEFLKEIGRTIYSSEDAFLKKWNTIQRRSKHSAVNLSHISMGPESRIEIRGVRPQANMDVFVHQIELLQNRINYLATLNKPIPLKLAVPLKRPIILEFEGNGNMLNPLVDPQQALEAFHLYVLESGSKWKDQRAYLWPKWLEDGEVDRYEASSTFHIYEETFRREACERALVPEFAEN